MNSRTKSSQIVTTNRRFDLDMRDRIRGVWDEEQGIPVISHLVIEATGISSERIDDKTKIEALIVSMCRACGLSRVGKPQIRVFPEHGGVTAIQILLTSHLAIHTWPESGYIHLDVVTCADDLEAAQAESALRELLHPLSVRVLKLRY